MVKRDSLGRKIKQSSRAKPGKHGPLSLLNKIAKKTKASGARLRYGGTSRNWDTRFALARALHEEGKLTWDQIEAKTELNKTTILRAIARVNNGQPARKTDSTKGGRPSLFTPFIKARFLETQRAQAMGVGYGYDDFVTAF